jgi:hypothetical protein
MLLLLLLDIAELDVLTNSLLLLFYLFFSWFHYLISSSAHPQPQVYGEQRAAHFRSMSPSHPQRQSAAPQTGLGILMKSSGTPPPQPLQQHILSQPPAPLNLTGAHHLLQPASFASLASNNNSNHINNNNNNKSRMQDDLADRELQASSLAAAGMVAESVQTTRPATGNVHVHHQGLQAPPALVGMAPPSQPPGGHLMEAVNWNQQLGLGDLNMGGVDDIDMDFATLFDPEQEQEYAMGEAMSGWTSSSNPSHAGSDMPDPSNSIPPSPTHYSGDHTNSTSV